MRMLCLAILDCKTNKYNTQQIFDFRLPIVDLKSKICWVLYLFVLQPKIAKQNISYMLYEAQEL